MEKFELEGKVVAVVDDHKALLTSMRGFLESCGARVLTYESGNQFLKDSPSVNCVVVDYYLPGLNGLDVAVELRNRAYSAPVILLTGMTSDVPEALAAKAGVVEIVDKLLGAHGLLSAIHRHVSPN